MTQNLDSRALRIVHVSQPSEAGVATVVRTLAAHGVERGDDVTVISPGDGPLGGWAVEAGARWRELPMARRPGLRDAVVFAQLWRLLGGADVVHLHSSKAGVIGRIAATARRSRPLIVFTPHGWSWYVGGRLATAYRATERWLSQRATDVITVVSAQELTDGYAVLGSDATLTLIANGVDVDQFTPTGPVADRTDDPLVVQVGRLSVQKAQDRTLCAVADLADQTVRVRFVGDGPERGRLTAQARKLNLEARVEFVGHCDPRPHLRAADVVAMPSRWEGMPISMLEAMATGAAIVASDAGGSEALVGVGRLIDSRDDATSVRELCTSLTELLSSPDERRRLGELALARAREKYTLLSCLRGYEEAWSSRGRQLVVPS